jgi:hypothetical protein
MCVVTGRAVQVTRLGCVQGHSRTPPRASLVPGACCSCHGLFVCGSAAVQLAWECSSSVALPCGCVFVWRQVTDRVSSRCGLHRSLWCTATGAAEAHNSMCPAFLLLVYGCQPRRRAPVAAGCTCLRSDPLVHSLQFSGHHHSLQMLLWGGPGGVPGMTVTDGVQVTCTPN